VAPRRVPTESYELGPVIAALEHRHFSEQDVVNNLSDAANLLRPRLQAAGTSLDCRRTDYSMLSTVGIEAVSVDPALSTFLSILFMTKCPRLNVSLSVFLTRAARLTEDSCSGTT